MRGRSHEFADYAATNKTRYYRNEPCLLYTSTPDFIAKVAFDPNSRFHVDLAGIERNFKTVNPSLLSQHFTTEGGGVELGINAEIFKGFRLINTDYWSDGGGRYLFGQAPDVIVRADGSLSPIHSGGFIGGFEDTIKNTLLYSYYGGIYLSLIHI